MVKLNDYTMAELKKMISSWKKEGIKFAGYSTMKKAELIDMIKSHLIVEEGDNAVKLSIIPTGTISDAEPDDPNDPDYDPAKDIEILIEEDEETE